jgi:hypothetical protein
MIPVSTRRRCAYSKEAFLSTVSPTPRIGASAMMADTIDPLPVRAKTLAAASLIAHDGHVGTDQERAG